MSVRIIFADWSQFNWIVVISIIYYDLFCFTSQMLFDVFSYKFNAICNRSSARRKIWLLSEKGYEDRMNKNYEDGSICFLSLWIIPDIIRNYNSISHDDAFVVDTIEIWYIMIYTSRCTLTSQQWIDVELDWSLEECLFCCLKIVSEY